MYESGTRKRFHPGIMINRHRRAVWIRAFDDIAETHQLETRVVQRDVARYRAGASLPAVRIIVAAPAANAVHTGTRAGTRQVIAARTCPLWSVGRPGRPETRVRVGSAHRSRKRKKATLQQNTCKRIGESAERRKSNTAQCCGLQVGAGTRVR